MILNKRKLFVKKCFKSSLDRYLFWGFSYSISRSPELNLTYPPRFLYFPIQVWLCSQKTKVWLCQETLTFVTSPDEAKNFVIKIKYLNK